MTARCAHRRGNPVEDSFDSMGKTCPSPRCARGGKMSRMDDAPVPAEQGRLPASSATQARGPLNHHGSQRLGVVEGVLQPKARLKSFLGGSAVNHFAQQKRSSPLHLDRSTRGNLARNEQTYSQVREIDELSALWRRGVLQIGHRYWLIGSKSGIAPILHIVQIDISPEGVTANSPALKPPP
jgi:hypothetical protein